ARRGDRRRGAGRRSGGHHDRGRPGSVTARGGSSRGARTPRSAGLPRAGGRMMQIALVIAGPYPALRGSQVLVRQIAHGLRERGHRVELVTYGSWMRARPGLHPARALLDPWLTVRLCYLVRSRSIDVIHAHNYEAAIAGLLVSSLTGCPLVYHGHSALAEELPTYARKPWARALLRQTGKFLDAQVPRRAAFCIAVTDELGTLLRRAGAAPASVACIAPTSMPGEGGPEGRGSEQVGPICYAGN